MAERDDATIHDALQTIDDALPDEAGPALSILLAASAAKSFEAGLSENRAVGHFITALKAVRKHSTTERMN